MVLRTVFDNGFQRDLSKVVSLSRVPDVFYSMVWAVA